MILKFFKFSVILVCSAYSECSSIELNNQVEGNSENYFEGCAAEEEQNYNFPEFEKVAEFLQPLIKHAEHHKCRNQLETLVKSLQNSSLWAVQMFDASTKTPNGVLTSDAYELGNYDACVDINLKRTKDNILGKYCLINLSMKKFDITPSQNEDIEADMKLWEKLMVPIFSYGFLNNLYRSAICMPNECLPRDVENVFGNLFKNTSKKIKKKIEISVPENACSTANRDEFIGVTYVKKITPAIVLWVAIVTIFDLLGWFPKSKNTCVGTLMNFSAYKNFKILNKANYREPISVINSLKVYTVILLVVTRRVSLFLAGPLMNRKDVDQVVDQNFKETFFFICNNIVADTFLVLDGFLHFYRVFSYYRKYYNLNIWSVYIFQFLNICPLYITAILFYGYIFEAVGTGPMWRERTEKLAQNCRENWVINLMNLNNFFKVSDMCIFQSWYFAVVAQCFVVVPILAKITQKTSTTGKVVFKLLIVAVLGLPIVKLYYSQESSQNFVNESGEVYWHQKLITTPMHRVSAYFFGILSSFIYLQTKKNKWKFLKIWGSTPFRAAIGVLFLCLCAEVNFKKMSSLQKVYISSCRQIFWCLFISGVVLGVFTKKLTGIATLLSGKYFFPLGRLTYSYLLVLDLIQIYSVGTMRTLDYFSVSRMIWLSSADLLATYVVAFICYMIIHRPISNILHETFIGV